tara:strand:+ start:1061 stop:1294 length:234 start_codon:yes stop_codon:yes gene_type:complete
VELHGINLFLMDFIEIGLEIRQILFRLCPLVLRQGDFLHVQVEGALEPPVAVVLQLRRKSLYGSPNILPIGKNVMEE